LLEICYLIDSRLGHAAMRRFVARALTGTMRIESLDRTDLIRAAEILDQYADARVL